jgi:HD-GYP domain-containing protein (c-di-GMP phosphodiesterase class II)
MTPSAQPPSVLRRLFGRRGWRIQVVVTVLMVASMGVMASFLVGASLVATEARLIQDANRDANTVAQLLSARTRSWLSPTTGALRQLALGTLSETTTLEARLAAVPGLVDELEAEPLLATLYIGWRNGDFLLVRPLRDPATRQQMQAPDGAQMMVQSIEVDDTGLAQHRLVFLGADGQVLALRPIPSTGFDPRTRPWFTGASDTDQTVQSPPYAFFTTGDVGITLSRRSADARAVVGADITLQTLATTLAEQRTLPAMRLALVDREARVLANADAPMAPVRHATQLLRLTDLQLPALEQLWALPETTTQAVLLEVDGSTWVGARTTAALGLGQRNVLLIATPFDALVAPARERARTVLALTAGLALLLLPLGWWGGRAIGRRLDDLRRNTARLVRFDFSHSPIQASGLREVNELSGTLAQMRTTIEAFSQLSQRMATEPELGRMLGDVLAQLVQALHAQAARVYLADAQGSTLTRTADAGTLASARPDSLKLSTPSPAGAVPPKADGLHQLDLPLLGRQGRLQGLLVLEVRADTAHRDPAFLAFAQRLSGMLAVAIETRELIQAQRQLFDAVIQLMASATDAKSAYTGGHCDRVPKMATALMERLCAETEGPYAGVQRNDEQRYAFHLGAWLHDCGKVTSPEHIVDKSTKLELIHNRIHEVRTRFEVLWRDADIAHLQRLQAGEAPEASAAQRDAEQAQLRDDFAFVARCNVGGEFMPDAAIERLRAIGGRHWQRHFDRRLGLSIEEAERLRTHLTDDPLPATEALLADRPEHTVPWGSRRPAVERDDPRNTHGFDMRLPAQAQHQGELHNLSVRRGTLTDEDRFKINEHIVQTFTMLKGLPWPAGLEGVPHMAATHHERLDGQGYPRRLSAEALTLEDRVMALADVFEALTAADRPYKPAKTLTESLRIMAFMARDHHLDPELFRYFLRSRLWAQFGHDFLRPAQQDAVDLDAIEALFAPATPAP